MLTMLCYMLQQIGYFISMNQLHIQIYDPSLIFKVRAILAVSGRLF